MVNVQETGSPFNLERFPMFKSLLLFSRDCTGHIILGGTEAALLLKEALIQSLALMQPNAFIDIVTYGENVIVLKYKIFSHSGIKHFIEF